MTPASDAYSALADVRVIGGVLDHWRAGSGAKAGAPWRCEYARLRSDAQSWAYCVYAGGDGSLMCIDALSGEDRANLLHPTLGPLRIAAFPDDAALPGLGKVMAMLDPLQIVRYRPGARCMLRGFVPRGERFVKVLPKGERLHDDAVKLWTAHQAGAFSFSVAEPHGWDAASCAFWQGVVAGRPIAQELFGPGGAGVAQRLGAALGELAVSGLEPSLVSRPAEYLSRTTNSLARIALLLPGLAPRLAQVSAELAKRHAALRAGRALLPVHGSPHMHQWLIDGGRLGLIDFDRYALGEPEFDLATFLAELDSERRLQTPVTAIEAALIQGFESTGVGIDPARLSLYRIYKHVATLKRRARALRPDAPARAERQLRTIEAMLAPVGHMPRVTLQTG